MAPMQTRKRKSDGMATTPTGSPAQKKIKITLAQKQALVDNLQLEVTERARHLRAHYALQCADLRARIERRINRIPISLRKANMGELYQKHLSSTQKASAPVAAVAMVKPPHPTKASLTQNRPLPQLPQDMSSKLPSPARFQAQLPSSRGKKRKSEEIVIASDKENEPAESTIDSLPVSKNAKRVKAGPVPRQVSKTVKSNNVLSPRSHNSRTLPRSPIKDYVANPSSPSKPSYIARPISPLKPASPLKSAASAATSAISASIHGMAEHAKRGAGKLTRTTSRENNPMTSIPKGKMLPPARPTTAPERTFSQSSNHSTTSSGSTTSTNTTVVKKGAKTATTLSQTTTTTKKTAAPISAAKTALKKSAAGANKKVVLAEPATGRRVLRKRN